MSYRIEILISCLFMGLGLGWGMGWVVVQLIRCWGGE